MKCVNACDLESSVLLKYIPAVRELLDKAVKVDPFIKGLYDPIIEAVKNNEFLFILLDDTDDPICAITVQVCEGYGSEKEAYAFIHHIGGKTAIMDEDSIKTVSDKLEEFAKSHNLAFLIGCGRLGWGKYLKNSGYKHCYDTYIKRF